MAIDAHGLQWRPTETMGLRLALTDARGREIAVVALSGAEAAFLINSVAVMMGAIIMTPFPAAVEQPMEG